MCCCVRLAQGLRKRAHGGGGGLGLCCKSHPYTDPVASAYTIAGSAHPTEGGSSGTARVLPVSSGGGGGGGGGNDDGGGDDSTGGDGGGGHSGGVGSSADGSGAGSSGDGDVEMWAYGGDFGEHVTDHDFCINGVIWPDRTVRYCCRRVLYMPKACMQDSPMC
jgi:hypothetical protein